MSAIVTFKSKVTAKGRHPDERRPFIEQSRGDDLHRKTGRWMRLERIIDRARDWYFERVTDAATGEVVRECEEPLRTHTGHGSARADGQQKGRVDS